MRGLRAPPALPAVRATAGTEAYPQTPRPTAAAIRAMPHPCKPIPLDCCFFTLFKLWRGIVLCRANDRLRVPYEASWSGRNDAWDVGYRGKPSRGASMRRGLAGAWPSAQLLPACDGARALRLDRLLLRRPSRRRPVGGHKYSERRVEHRARHQPPERDRHCEGRLCRRRTDRAQLPVRLGVVGAEASISATNLSGSATGPTSANTTLRMTSAPMDFGAVTGRIGYAFNTVLPM